MDWMYFAATGVVVLLLSVGKDAPLQKVFGKVKETLKKASPSTVPVVAYKADPRNNRLPSWISDANDWQQMLLFLANQAAQCGNVELKDATLDLMKPYADLQVAVKE